MQNLPQRHSLPRQAADIITQMIANGELCDFLPGERDLAARLQVGRDTIRAALEILETDEAITASIHGRRREIIKKRDSNSKPEQIKRIAFLSPKLLTELPPWMLIEFDTLRNLLNLRDYELELITAGVFHHKDPGARLRKLIDSNPSCIWILYQCPKPVQQWFQKNHIPSLIRGYSHEDIEIPSIDEDWKAAAFHAGGELTRQGHTSVGLLMPNTKLAGLTATEAGLRQAIESNNNGAVHKIVDKISAASVHIALERAFKLKNPPTAIVTTRTRHVLSVITWLAQHHIRIPQDLSIISLAYETWFEQITPKISHYKSSPDTLAKTVMRAISNIAENKSKKNENKILIPDYVKGQSLRKKDKG